MRAKYSDNELGIGQIYGDLIEIGGSDSEANPIGRKLPPFQKETLISCSTFLKLLEPPNILTKSDLL